MNLNNARKYAERKMSEHGLIQEGWIFYFDRAIQRFGVCKENKKEITISKKLTLMNSDEDVKDVILHEIAHALVGAVNGHNRHWKRKCVEIGAKPERTYEAVRVKAPEPKYQVKCKDCGRVVGRHKMSSIIKYPENWRCGICKGKFERIK